jgi:hypothetical protein
MAAETNSVSSTTVHRIPIVLYLSQTVAPAAEKRPVSASNIVRVACHECGMSAEIRLEAFGLRYHITDIASHSKCKYEWRGMSALGCSGLKPELSKARASLAQEERLSV